MSILHGPLHDGRFSKWSHFLNIWRFFDRFLVQNNFKWFVEWMLTVFWNFNFLPKVGILRGLQSLHDGRFSKWSHFSNIWCFSRVVFAQNDSKCFVEWMLTCFLEFSFLTQSENFAWAMTFAWWPIFKIVPFLQYLVFFRVVFFAQNNSKWFLDWILTWFLEF